MSESDIKLAHIIRSDVSDDELLFLQQLGLRWVLLRHGDRDPGVDALRAVQARCEQALQSIEEEATS